MMLPDWLSTQDCCTPSRGSSRFAARTIRSLGGAMAGIRIQRGREDRHTIPVLPKVLLLLAWLLLVTLCRGRLMLLTLAAVFLVCLCVRPALEILRILRTTLLAVLLTVLLMLPAIFLMPSGHAGQLTLVLRVFLSIGMLCLFSSTTQWNHFTSALRRLHIPGIFIFTLDITLKYIVLLGEFLQQLMTALLLRSVGRNRHRSRSAGGAMGTTLLRGTELNRQMYEAMQCRCFTDDYKGL